jgi:phosphocarrier protein FPr
VSAGYNVKILIPMVSTVSEVREARDCLLRAGDGLRSEDVPFDEGIEMGIMIEIPSAALMAEQLATESGFLSIGTNDLCQYAMAADRSNAAVAELNDALHPAVLRLVWRVVEAGKAAGKRVSVCGEIGADPVAVPVLVGLGVESLSVGPDAIPSVKRAVRLLDSRECAELAHEALTLESAAGVRELIARAIPAIRG